MFTNRSFRLFVTIVLLVLVFAVRAAYFAPALAGEPAQESISDVYWWWDNQNAVGTSRLVRTEKGIHADLTTSGLTADQAYTLWFVVFNYPENCFITEKKATCTDFDIPNPAVGADFLYSSGDVIAKDGNAIFGGSLKKIAEDRSAYGTGLGELLCLLDEECDDPATITTPGLKEPMTAEIHLIMHSHGPAHRRSLAAQLSYFLGGCDEDGLKPSPAGPNDLWDEYGVCQSTQFSIHQ